MACLEKLLIRVFCGVPAKQERQLSYNKFSQTHVLLIFCFLKRLKSLPWDHFMQALWGNDLL
jgi:hypothetical protein